MTDEQLWDRICVIDTENRSGSLYVGTSVGGVTIGSFNAIDFDPPFSAQRYLEAIKMAQNAGMEFLIIDSLSHAWAGEGGLLEVQGNIAKRTGNSYTAWRDVTPQHNMLVESILQCDMHIAITLRSKTEYVVEENERGKKTPRKVGTEPVFRNGIEYELTTFFDIGIDHTASVTKDRTTLFDGRFFQITPDTGAMIQSWLTDAPPVKPSRLPEPTQVPLAEQVDTLMKRVCQNLSKEEKEQVAQQIKEITGGIANYRTVTEEDTLRRILDHFMEASR